MKLFTLVADLTLDTSGFATQVAKAKADVESLAEAIGEDSESIKESFSDAFSFTVGDLMADAIRGMSEWSIEFVKGGVTIASSMEEVQNVVDTTFGSSAGQIDEWAKQTARAYGVGELAAKQFSGTMGSVLQGMGIGEENLFDMSTALVQLAGDMASFYNLDTETAFYKVMSGMTGEMEPLRQLGIVMSAVNLEAHALAMGIETSWEKMDSATQTQVRYSYLMQQTEKAQGDFTKTADSYANQMRDLEINIIALQNTIGGMLLPVLTDVVTWFNSIFDGSEDASSGLDAIKDAATDSMVSIETTTTNALALIEALEELEAAGEDTAGSEMWNEILGQLQQTLPEIGNLIDTETGKITGGTAALEAYVEQWRTTSMELAQQKVVQDMYDEYAALQAELAKLQTEQQIADTLRSGAAKSMDVMGADLLAVMLQGMENMGASAEDIKAMQAFGAEGAENLLARLAGGGSVTAVMGALLKGGDIWKNKSFEKYFEAGGGTDAMLSNMIALYQGYQKTFEQYNIDNADEIAERQALLAGQEQEITVMRQILAQLAANGSMVVNVTIDSEPVAAKVEQRMQRNTQNAFVAHR